MSKEIIVDINAHQTRVATLEDGELLDLFIERAGRERIVGNIYIGRVQNVLPGMQAAFVDIGLEKNAFLFAGDILADPSDLEFSDRTDKPAIAGNIKEIVKPGQEVLLQILKEPVGNKGARVTTHITLPGRTLVLMPTVNYIGVSRRIEDEDERVRLREIIDRIKPQNMGVIVRTAAVGKSEEDFAGDLKLLCGLWGRVCQRAKMLSPPKLIHSEETLVFRTIRDMFSADTRRLVINDVQAYEKVRVVVGILAPERIDCVQLYQESEDLFDHYELESRIDKLLCRKVWLKSGGYIVIDQTEAFTVIDVNTGKYVGNDSLQETLLQTNIEAAREIAWQLRLRDIGGIIIIDFIDMEEQSDKDGLIQILQEALKTDPTKSNVVGMTGLGLVEMTRKKVRKSLSATLQTTCKYCHGDGRVQNSETVALKIRKALQRELRQAQNDIWLVEAHPSVTAVIEAGTRDDDPVLVPYEGKSVYIRALSSLHVEEFRITPVTEQRMLENIQTDAKIFR